MECASELDARHYSGTATRIIVDHVRNHGRPGAIEELWQLAGELRSVEDVRSDSAWSTYGQFRSLLEAAAVVTGGVDNLVEFARSSDLFGSQNVDHTDLVLNLGSPAALYGDPRQGTRDDHHDRRGRDRVGRRDRVARSGLR